MNAKDRIAQRFGNGVYTERHDQHEAARLQGSRAFGGSLAGSLRASRSS